mmetsp:Transcript_17099/g.37287  ORF Transcript_17099/g.37287 Transcript_17099/m.37287 type:complete len:556 (+) Transcript_17099:108-1775(+)
MISGRPEKRRRPAAADEEDTSTCSSSWDDMVQCISSSGGTVHPSLTCSSSSDRSVKTTSDVSAGTILMQIPSSCLLSSNAECLTATDYGIRLIDAVNLASQQQRLCNNISDLLLAFFMAHAASQSNTNQIVSSYLATLPPPISYNGIPRRWNEDQLTSLLGGTSLLRQVRADQRDLRSDYDAISASWNAGTDQHTSTMETGTSLPTFQQFDDMFAAVSSRGFAGLGSDDGTIDAMVPLLDLLDHRRGAGCKKDVRYRRTRTSIVPSKQDNGTHEAVSAVVVGVVADRDLPAGSVVHDTYGAKGNAQLLSRYGFCIDSNVEPDGSSNDVVEFVAKEGSPAVELRAGPKAYTYGGFVRALEVFLDDGDGGKGHDGCGGDSGGATSSDEPDDMMAFLNQCDEEDAGGFDMLYGNGMDDKESDDGDGDGGDDGDDNDDGGSAEAIKAECTALGRLSTALGRARDRYSLKGKDLQEGLDKKDFSPQYCAAVLVQSERRTLQLFQLAADKIRRRLQGEREEGGSSSSSSSNEEDCSSTTLAQVHVDELIEAYFAIRHNGLR